MGSCPVGDYRAPLRLISAASEVSVKAAALWFDCMLMAAVERTITTVHCLCQPWKSCSRETATCIAHIADTAMLELRSAFIVWGHSTSHFPCPKDAHSFLAPLPCQFLGLVKLGRAVEALVTVRFKATMPLYHIYGSLFSSWSCLTCVFRYNAAAQCV